VADFFREVAELAAADPDAAAKRAAAGIWELAGEKFDDLREVGASVATLRRYISTILALFAECPVRDRMAALPEFSDFRSWLEVPSPPPENLVSGFVRVLLSLHPVPTPPTPAKPPLAAFRESFSPRDRFLQRLGASVGVVRALGQGMFRHPLATLRLARDLLAAARSCLFDRTFYAWAYPEVTARRFSSPLLHYCLHGWREGRRFSSAVPPFPPEVFPVGENPLLLHARLFPRKQPTPNTVRLLWRRLCPDLWEKTVVERLHAEVAPKPNLAVVVPVHNHPELLPPLAASLLEHTPPDVLLLFVDDASSDPAVRSLLLRLAADHPGRVQVEYLDANRGYAAACNHGIRLVASRDVILLNSDTVVGPRWTDSLRLAAYAAPRIGTVTPVSDNAWFASVPEEGPNQMPPGLSAAETARFWLQAPEFAFDQHTGHGFCLYLRRDMLDDVGLLDEATFGGGYGEEIDLCLRAWNRGWQHRITTRAFVHHLHGASFAPLHRAFRIEASTAALQARYPEFPSLKALHRPQWAARRPVFRWLDARLRSYAAPRPWPRVLVASPDAAPPGSDPFVLERSPDVWRLFDRSRSALAEDGPGGFPVERLPLAGLSPAQIDDALVGWLLDHGIERIASPSLLNGRPALADRLADLHIPVAAAPAPPASPAPVPPLVSVVVPVHNVRRWLPRCLDALLAQTLRDIEIVCVDDGSTDGSDAILRRYAARDSRIVALFSENHGVEWARSLAVERASGRYLMFCDPDDEYEPAMCATMAGAMDRLGVDLAICSARHEGPFTEREKNRRRRPDVERGPAEIRGRDDVLWNKIFRRDLVGQSGLRFPRDPAIRRGFDAVFGFCYQLVARSAATLSDRLYVYCRRKGSLADLRNRRKLRSSLDAVHELPLVFAFAEANRLPPAKSAQILPWCDQIVAEAIPAMNDRDRPAGLRALRALFAPKTSLLGPATPWLRAVAADDSAALAVLLAERAKREAAAAPPPKPSVRARLHAVAAAAARCLPILGTHLRAVDACLAELRRAKAARAAEAALSARYAHRLRRAEHSVRSLLLDPASPASPGTSGRGPDVPGAVVVSFTSYPARIQIAAAAAASLLRQDAKPDAVVLWLDEADFPRRDADLPPVFDALRRRGLDVRWCRPGLRSYKKLVPSLETWPDAVLVTADDDIFYPRDWLGGLLAAHRIHPSDIAAYRVRRIVFDALCRPRPYAQWPLNEPESEGTPPVSLLPTTGGGVLFPPRSLHPDATDEATFLRVAPAADDLWFWAMAARNATRVRRVLSAASEIQSLDTALELGPDTLFRSNSDGGNDRQFLAILNEFPSLFRDAGSPIP
jgi:GT2 family glycosyltransferase